MGAADTPVNRGSAAGRCSVTLGSGERLRSGPQLSQRFGVAKATAEQAVCILRDEGLMVSRNGRGVYVRERAERPVGLRPHIEQSFGSSTVTIDFAGFSGETLHGAIAEPIDRIREGGFDRIRSRYECSFRIYPRRGRFPRGWTTWPTVPHFVAVLPASWSGTRWRSSML